MFEYFWFLDAHIYFCYFLENWLLLGPANHPQLTLNTAFASDPLGMPSTLYTEVDPDIRETIQNHWRQIRTRQSRHNRLQDWYSYRLTAQGHQQFPEYLRQILADQSSVFKINLAFGYILRNNETDALQYYHASSNNHLVLDEPYQITNHNDLQALIEVLGNIDFIEWIKQQRINSKWIVDWVTNVTFFVTKIRGHPIGKATTLPPYILNNKAVLSLECDANSGTPYQDWLCFFRCLAVHHGCHLKNLHRDTMYYFQQ